MTNALLVGARITNSFGQPAGGIVIRYDPTPLDMRVYAVLLDMVRAGLLAVVVTSGIAVIAAPLLTRELRRWLTRAAADVSSAHLATVESPAILASPILHAIAQASQDLTEMETELMRLGMAETEQSFAA